MHVSWNNILTILFIFVCPAVLSCLAQPHRVSEVSAQLFNISLSMVLVFSSFTESMEPSPFRLSLIPSIHNWARAQVKSGRAQTLIVHLSLVVLRFLHFFSNHYVIHLFYYTHTSQTDRQAGKIFVFWCNCMYI